MLKKMVLPFLCAVLLFNALIGSLPVYATAEPDTEKAVVGYYGAWASDMGFPPQQIDVQGLTHLLYAFAHPNGSSGTVELTEPERDKRNLEALGSLRKNHPRLKLLLSVGGWDGSLNFSDAVSTASKREAFVSSCISLIRSYALDGVDLDWEYPVSGGPEGSSHRIQDKQNFTLLLHTLREELDRLGKKDGKSYFLTAAIPADPGYFQKVETTSIVPLVDHLFLMAYDFHGPWDPYADLNAPLYSPNGNSPQWKFGIYDSIRQCIAQGIPADKLVLGMPLYGYLYRGVSGQNNGLFSAYSSCSSLAWDEIEQNYLKNPNYRKVYLEESKVPYLYGNGSFLSYDDPQSAAEKGKLAKELGLHGIGFWEISKDRSASLINSACSAFYSRTFSDVKASDWYFDAVQYAWENELMTGTSPSAFSPNALMTRGMAATVLYRMEGSPSAAGMKNPFSDVSLNAYYTDAVKWAASQGILTGFDDLHFMPNDPITREQMATMIYRYGQFKGYDLSIKGDLSRFSDKAQISTYAHSALEWAAGSGLVNGRSASFLSPKGTTTRAESAAIFSRFHAMNP